MNAGSYKKNARGKKKEEGKFDKKRIPLRLPRNLKKTKCQLLGYQNIFMKY